jgi:tetratricopeptide (TPR) repeat protein
VNPKDYKVLSTWGWYLEVQGKNKEAIEKYKEALIINPSYAYAKNHLKDLEKQIVTQPQPAK